MLFKCELIHKFNFKPNKQQPLRLTEERCHQWRRKQDPPSPQSCKETRSRENPSCLVQMRLEYLAEAVFSGFWSQFSEFLAEPCSSGLLVGHLSPSVALCSQQGFAAGTPGSTWHLLYPSFVCHQAAGSGPVRQLCGREGWPGHGICSQKPHGFSHGFYWNFWSYLCWAAV